MKKNLRRALPWAVLALCYLFTVGVFALYGAHNIDSDMSGEMVLAQLLNEEGGFLSENWLYSTELRVVSPVPVYQLGLRLFPGSWHAARTFSIAVLLALTAAAFIYMGRGAGLRDSAVYAAGLCLLPVSEVHRFLFSQGGFYTVYVIFACLLVGLTLRMDCRKGRALRCLLLLALGFVCGLSGVRMPMICGAPLALACALEAFSMLRRAASLREAAALEQAHLLAGSALAAAAMLAGYLVNTRVLERMYSFESYHEMLLGDAGFSLYDKQLRYVLEFFGLNTGVPLLSAGALTDMLMLGVCLLMAAALCWLLVRRRELGARQRVLTYFAGFALALGMFVTAVTDRTTTVYCVGYYIMGVLVPVLLLLMCLERMPCRMAGVRTAAMLAVCAVFLLEAGSFVHSYVRREETEHEEAAAWLVENGYTTGFASFWYGNVLTEASDGALEMYIYSAWEEPELNSWLQRADHFETLPDGPVFVYVNSVEFWTDAVEWAQEDHLVFHSDRFDTRIYAYDSAQEVVALQQQAALSRAEHEEAGSGIE